MKQNSLRHHLTDYKLFQNCNLKLRINLTILILRWLSAGTDTDASFRAKGESNCDQAGI